MNPTFQFCTPAAKPTAEQRVLVENLAEIISGLQVPMSIAGGRMLGAAYDPLVAVRNSLNLFGYPIKKEVEARLSEKLYPQNP